MIPRTNNFYAYPSPSHLLVAYDDDILNKNVGLYSWQRRHHEDFAAPFTAETLRRQQLVAANGSGKSKYCLAPELIYLATQYDNTLGVATTSSTHQMDTQTERHLRQLAEAMNRFHRDDPNMNPEWKGEIWDIKFRSLFFKPTNSPIDLFVTDEAKRAEGRHPLKKNAPFVYAFDEAKSVSDEIYSSRDRCNGATHWLDFSSPGDLAGQFYQNYVDSDAPWLKYKVTCYDCPHIRETEINELIRKWGIDDPLVRSSLFAEFTAVDSPLVLRKETLDKCLAFWKGANKSPSLWGEPRAGLDLAAGGDENVLSVWHGDKQLAQECFRHKDTTATRKELVELFRKWNLKPSNIWADDGGVGRGIIDQLGESGYKVNRVLNQWRPFDKTRYKNRGTEIWFSFKRYIEEYRISLVDDKKLHSQLSNRYYKRPDSNQYILESKQTAKAHGHPSPDRADAAVLAWTAFPFNESSLIEQAAKEEPREATLAECAANFESAQRRRLLGQDKKPAPAYDGEAAYSLYNRINNHLNNKSRAAGNLNYLIRR